MEFVLISPRRSADTHEHPFGVHQDSGDSHSFGRQRDRWRDSARLRSSTGEVGAGVRARAFGRQPDR